MIHTLDTIIEHRFLDPDIAREVAKTSRHVFREGKEIVASTMTVDAFVREVKAAIGDEAAQEASRKIQFERMRERLRGLSNES